MNGATTFVDCASIPVLKEASSMMNRAVFTALSAPSSSSVRRPARPTLCRPIRRPSRRPGVWLGMLALAAVGSGCTAPEPPALSCDLGLVEAIEVDRMMNHLAFLTEDIGPRVASSPQEREAAEYLAEVLTSYGYETTLQVFDRTTLFGSLEVGDGQEAFPVASGRLQGVPASEYPLLTGVEGVSGPLVDCGANGPTACSDEVDGAIVLLAPSDTPQADRLEAMAEAGARGAIFHGEGWQRFMVSMSAASIPFVSIEGEGGERLRGDHLGAQVTLRIERFEQSQNVLATRHAQTEDPDSAPILIVTAHYDSVEKAPGASDNGSGTVGLLEIARILAQVPVEVEVRFAAVGAEEVGLVGSRFYAANLTDEERARVLANFNMDMIGTAGEAQTQLFVNTLDGDNLVSQSARAARDALGFPEDLLRAPFQRGASDHVAFHEIGIPAANFIWREPETIALEPWYHHPHDRLENISPERLHTALQVVLGAMVEVMCPAAQG